MIRYMFFLVFIGSSVQAQDTLQSSDFSRLPRHTIKFSPFHLFNYYPTVQLAYELKLDPMYSIQVDGGMVIGRGTNEDDENKNKRGYKLKIEPRHYYKFGRRRALGGYIALELYRNDVDFDRTSEEIECFEPNCQDKYRRTYRYTANYTEHGVAFKTGMVKYFGSFMFDINGGLGARFIDYTFPPHITPPDHDWLEVPNMSDRRAFTPIINFRLGYWIR